MVTKQKIKLPDEAIRRCDDYAAKVVKGYADGRWPQSRAVSSHGAEKNAVLWSNGKRAEVGFCLAAGLNPNTEVAWEPGIDGGSDTLYEGLRVDLKHTKMGNKYLTWPINKNGIYLTKQFDVIVLVFIDGAWCQVVCYAWKRQFYFNKAIAPSRHKLDQGTWYMPIEKCIDIGRL